MKRHKMKRFLWVRGRKGTEPRTFAEQNANFQPTISRRPSCIAPHQGSVLLGFFRLNGCDGSRWIQTVQVSEWERRLNKKFSKSPCIHRNPLDSEWHCREPYNVHLMRTKAKHPMVRSQPNTKTNKPTQTRQPQPKQNHTRQAHVAFPHELCNQLRHS